MGHLLGIAIRHKKRGEMQELASAHVTATSGVADDFRGKPGNRQVTVLSIEDWQSACKEINQTLPWSTRRANLYIEGIDLYNTAGQHLHIGQLVLLITRETDPCKRMQEAHEGLFEALAKQWRGGACCRVIQEGEIATGSQVELINAP
ncbi:MAG: MOSC domain-containing protein [Gammaproteobacteria bacterium]|nr:MOSC domain-containing protein [Gammaproteobacteria bacterium]